MASLIESLGKATILMGLVLAAMPLLKRRSAALRHWVLMAALACAAAQPLLSLMAPRWTLPSSRVLSTSSAFTTDSSIEIVDVSNGTGVAKTDAAIDISWSERVPLRWLLLGTWLCGVLMGLGTLLAGLAQLARITSGARAASGEWLVVTADVSERLRLRRPARMRITDHPALLVTWGIRRPLVLLPRDADSWSRDRVRAVVSHELAHVQRKDWPIQLAAEIIRAGCWFHPLFWMACARLRLESEHACDDLVLGLGIDRRSYASHLVALARAFKAHGRSWVPAPAIARPSTLQWRIRAMLNLNLDRRPVPASRRCAILIAMLCVSFSLAGLHAQTTSVTGTLHDASGRVLPEAAVRLVHKESGATYEIQSDQTGRFRFTAVAPGDYVLSARAMGFSPVIETIAVAAGDGVQRDMTLRVASLQETISVRGGGRAEDYAKRRPQEAIDVAQPSCTPSATGGHIVPPTKIRNVPPQYPQNLQDANVTGTVLLVADVGTDGLVHDVRPFSHGDPGLEEAAVIAVKQWRFTPTLLNCHPIDVQMLATVTFSMTP